MIDPYEALDPRTKKQIELDTLPKDETHPFHGLPQKEAARYYEAALDSAGPEVMPDPTEIPKREALKDAYRNKVAAEHSLKAHRAADAREYEDQEKAHLGKR